MSNVPFLVNPSCLPSFSQTSRAASTRGESFTATATGISAADTPGRMPRRTAGSTAVIWPASTLQQSRISSEVGGGRNLFTERKPIETTPRREIHQAVQSLYLFEIVAFMLLLLFLLLDSLSTL